MKMCFSLQIILPLTRSLMANTEMDRLQNLPQTQWLSIGLSYAFNKD